LFRRSVILIIIIATVVLIVSSTATATVYYARRRRRFVPDCCRRRRRRRRRYRDVLPVIIITITTIRAVNGTAATLTPSPAVVLMRIRALRAVRTSAASFGKRERESQCGHSSMLKRSKGTNERERERSHTHTRACARIERENVVLKKIQKRGSNPLGFFSRSSHSNQKHGPMISTRFF
jgi:heme/copper-type cytochrome/quinol oxidase subunit 2